MSGHSKPVSFILCSEEEEWLKATYPEYRDLKEQQAERWKSMGFWERANTVRDAVFTTEAQECLRKVGFHKVDSATVHASVRAFIQAKKRSN